MQDFEKIAKVCHEVNRALCEFNGDYSQSKWEDAPEWQRDSAVKGVEFTVENTGSAPKDQHDSWAKEKITQGWVYGEQKNASKMTHPCLVEYEDLPPEQRIKGHVFRAIVKAMI